MYYLLDIHGEAVRWDGTPREWAHKIAAQREEGLLRLAETWINTETKVLTVFLGIDHSHNGHPELFETRVYRGKEPILERYSATRHEAEEAHEAMVKKLRQGGWS